MRKDIAFKDKQHEFLIFIVGKSGSGKNELIRLMDLEKYSFEISSAAKKELKKRGVEVTHDNIQSMMHKRYTDDPYWQIPLILRELKRKKLLILNGCRSFSEFEKLLEVCPNNLVIEVRTRKSLRKRRLVLRESIDDSGFLRVEEDEKKATELPKIVREGYVDIVISNNGSRKTFEKKSKKLVTLLSTFAS